MEQNKEWWIWMLFGVLLGMLFICLLDNKFGKDENIFSKPDTTFNKIKLDSIKVKVGQHDTTIYKLNIKLKEDVQKSYQLNDSATIDMFKKLSTEN